MRKNNSEKTKVTSKVVSDGSKLNFGLDEERVDEIMKQASHIGSGLVVHKLKQAKNGDGEGVISNQEIVQKIKDGVTVTSIDEAFALGYMASSISHGITALFENDLDVKKAMDALERSL